MIPPSVQVLVINWNGREHLRDCFASLCVSTYENAHFILVDNGSDDDSIDFVNAEFGTDSRVSILALAENLGWSGGNNVGLRQAQQQGADFVFLLNNDTKVAPDCIEKMVEAMEERPNCGALAPRMLLFDQPALINSVGLEMSIIGAAWDRGIGRSDTDAWHEATEVVGVCGGACFLRTSVLDATGLLPEDFDIYLDDLDLCLRIWEAGHPVWTCPEAIVHHKFSATMGTGKWARRKYYLNTRNRFRVLLRNFPLWRLLHALPYVLLGEGKAIGRALLDGAPERVLAHLRAWLSTGVYLPRAWSARRRQRALGAIRSPYWHLVRRSPLFCPHVHLPVDGWFAPIDFEGESWRPMAARATLPVSAGSLRVLLANCYPEAGSVEVVVSMDESPLGALSGAHRAEATFDVQDGTLALQARSFFPSTQGEGTANTGAWLQIWCGNNRLV